MMAIAEHHPEQLYPENRGVLKMTKGQLSEFATTSEKGLPSKKKKRTHHSAPMGEFWEKRSNL
jgi:hypothetical protein